MEVSGNGSKRNLKRNSKFSSNEDARTLRAVQRKLEQKKQRNKSLAQNRCISTPHGRKYTDVGDGQSTPLVRVGCKPNSQSLTSTTKKYSKKELEKLGRIRYNSMLQWKEDKKKLLEIEKQKRKPAFFAGVYKPEIPKFLVGCDEDSSKQNTTPWKSANKQNALKSITKTVYESTNCMGNRSVYKPLKFSSNRLTPQTDDNKRILKTADTLHGKRLRVSRAFRSPPNDLGIRPLPFTPAACDDLKLKKRLASPAKSFAPKLFNFEAPTGLKLYDIFSNNKTENKTSKNFEDVITEVDRNREDSKIIVDESSQNSKGKYTCKNMDEESFGKTVEFDDHNPRLFTSEQLNLPPFDNENAENKTSKNFEDVITAVDGNIEDCKINVDDSSKNLKGKHTDKNIDEEAFGNNVEFDDHNSILCTSEQLNVPPFDNKRAESTSDVEKNDTINTLVKSTVAVQNDCESSIEVCLKNETKQCDKFEDSSCIIGEAALKLYDSSETEDEELILPSLEKSKLVLNAGSTPAPILRRKTRSSLFSIKEIDSLTFTPASRLRPRTQCSRSTRRSHSAHCDEFLSDSILTPSIRSTKKARKSSIRRSIMEATNEDKDIPEEKVASISSASPSKILTQNIITKKESLFSSSLHKFGADASCNSEIYNTNESPFRTPVSQHLKKTPSLRARISSLVDTSPWIDKSRRSTSSKGKQRRSIFSNELECMFNDLPLDGSIPASLANEMCSDASPILNHSSKINASDNLHLAYSDDRNNSLKENATPKLTPTYPSEFIKLLQPSTSTFLGKGTPENLIWGPDSANSSPANLLDNICANSIIEGAHKYQEVSGRLVLAKNNLREPLIEIPVSSNSGKGSRRSRKSSVSFAISESSSDKIGCKFPTTPNIHSSKVSLGIFSNVQNNDSVINSIKPGDDLIQWDSPIALKGLRRKSQKKLAPRISLLPGLEHYSEQVNENISEQVPIEGDLISFDTPTNAFDKKIKKRTSKTAVDTPLRRSKRVSKVLP